MGGLEVIALFSGPVAWVGLWDRSAPRRWGGDTFSSPTAEARARGSAAYLLRCCFKRHVTF